MRPTTLRAGPAMDNVTLALSQSNAGAEASPGGSVGSGFGPGAHAHPIGIYIHFPWCLVKCPYCDFVAYRKPPSRIDHGAYADAVLAELEARALPLRDRPGTCAVSVFFGGGTPGLWDPAELGRVLRGAATACPQRATVARPEVSVECDPAAFDEDTARTLVDLGVTRVSIGVQGFDDSRLSFLGRVHSAAQARQAIRAALRGRIPHVAVDLIHAAPGLLPETAAREAKEAVELGATHVSAYGLTIEPNTVFGKLARQGRLPLVEDAVAADSFYAIDEALTRLGLEHYEISNYAAPGHRSVHNVGYWIGGEYLGLGTGAVGMIALPPGAPTRYRNQPHPQRYLEAVRDLVRAPRDDDGTCRAAALAALAVDRETLDPAMRLRERIMLGLRMAEGLDLAEAARACGTDPWPEARRRAALLLERRGRLARRENRIWIPRKAWIWADATAAALF
jgi:putative oxygen-independent coproporphyrinogen III oxidase